MLGIRQAILTLTLCLVLIVMSLACDLEIETISTPVIASPTPSSISEIPTEFWDVRETIGITHCQLHNEPLLEGFVPIIYGLPVFDPEFWDVKQSNFPNSYSSWGGGCIVEELKYALVRYCPKCREAEEAWKRGH